MVQQMANGVKHPQMCASPNNKQNKTQTTFVFLLWCVTLVSLQPPMHILEYNLILN